MTMSPEFDARLDHCIACHSPDIHHLLTDFRGIDIYQCRCGMRFMNPQYSDAWLTHYYSNQYIKEDPVDTQRAYIEGHDYYLSLTEAAGARPGRMLDIGCGNGYLLEAAIARGWTVTGHDVDPAITAQVSRRLDVPVLTGDFLELDLGHDIDGPYDLVTMHQVLEHLKDPADYLDKVRKLLAPGGHFFVAVPNISSTSNRLKSLMESAGLRRRNVGKYYDSDHHLSYFSPRVLTGFLERHGFRTLKVANCHAARAGRSVIGRALTRHVLERLYSKSSFLVIARAV